MVEQPVRRQYRAIHVALVVMLVLLAGQLYNMQILQGETYKAKAQNSRERTLLLKATRGVLYDRNGARLVTNNPSYSIAVTAADVEDINCAAGPGALESQVLTTSLFTELAATLNQTQTTGVTTTVEPLVKYVITVKPKELPLEKVGEVANRLSVPLQAVNYKETIFAPLTPTVSSNPESENLFLLRKDMTEAEAKGIRAPLEFLPGIQVYNELEYNFIRGFSNCSKPVVVKRGVDYNPMQAVASTLSKLPGVSIEPEPVRQYADGSLLSHLLGYVGPISREDYDQAPGVYEPDDKVGQTGIEASMEKELRGAKGEARVMVNSKERIVTEVSSRPPITGNNVTLTLDTKLQKAVTTALQDGITKANVKSGVADVMRGDNGQVLSMVSLPSYDNNLFSAGISQADFDRLNTDPALPMFNRAIGGAYPPGSTYKMITAAAALQEGVVTPDTTYVCPGYIEVPYTWDEKTRNPFRDWRAQGHGTINVVQALTVSSDVFFYIAAGPKQEDRKIIKADGAEDILWTRYYTPGAKKYTEFNGLGIAKLERYATAFGLGQKTGIELPGEVAGLSPDPEWKEEIDPDNNWSMGDTLVTAIGQGYNLMTPLQLVNVTAAVANGGTLYQPQLVEKVTDWSGNVVQGYQPKVLGQVPVSQENLALVRKGMRQVIADKVKGTAANRFTLKSIPVAGKTGTAEYGEIVSMKDGKEIRRSHAWFTAFAPYDKPEIAVVVLLEGGQESLEGSTFAVPVTDAIMKAYFKVSE